MALVQLEMQDVVHIIQSQKAVIDHQKALLDHMSSRAGSEASTLVRGEGLNQAFQKLTLDQQQDTEKFILHRGTYMPESEFEAMADADDEEHTAVAPKSWYKCDFTDVHFKRYKHPKDKTHHTCEECNGFWVKTGNAPTTIGSTELSGSIDMVDTEAAPPAATTDAWETVSALPKGVLQEWQLRQVSIPITGAPSRFTCGKCRATWFETEKITAVGGM